MPKKTTTKKAVATKKAKAPSAKTAKKSVAKKTTKKAVAKKSSKASPAMAACSCMKKCEPAQAFWVNNGPVVKSVEHLLKALKEMSDEQYAYHTKREGNDFAKWVLDCLGDSATATSLKKARTRVGAVRTLSKKCACL